MISTLDISGSALVAQRTRLDVIAGNIANADATRREDGTPGPYQRRYVTFAAARADGGPGVRVVQVLADPAPPREKYEPTHVDADARGYVQYPNVNTTLEFVDGLAASRAYEANAAMLGVTRTMVQHAIRLFA